MIAPAGWLVGSPTGSRAEPGGATCLVLVGGPRQQGKLYIPAQAMARAALPQTNMQRCWASRRSCWPAPTTCRALAARGAPGANGARVRAAAAHQDLRQVRAPHAGNLTVTLHGGACVRAAAAHAAVRRVCAHRTQTQWGEACSAEQGADVTSATHTVLARCLWRVRMPSAA